MKKLIIAISLIILLSGCGRSFNINSETAEEIVLKDIGAKSADYVETALSFEEGTEVYKISVVYQGKNYFYTLNTENGDILNKK